MQKKNTMSLSEKSTYLFETIRLINGVAQHLNFHERRARSSVKFGELNFKFSEILGCSLNGLVRAKVVYNEDGKLIDVNFHPYKMRKFYEFYLVDINFSYDKKYLNRSQIDSAKDKFDEIVMIKNGFITDTSIANIAVFDENLHRWITPANPLLKGTCTQRLLQSGFLHAKDISTNELISAKRFAIANAMMDFCEIKEFKLIY